MMKPTRELMEWAAHVIDKDLATLGSVESGVAIMEAADIHATITLNGPGVEERKAFTIDVIQKMRTRGTLTGVVLIAEAWMTPVEGSASIPAGEPSDRQDGLIAEVFGRDGKMFSIWPIERGSGTVKRGAAKDFGDAMGVGWLDEAFQHESGTA